MSSIRLTATFRSDMSADELLAIADKVAATIDAPSVRVRIETRADVYRNADHVAHDYDLVDPDDDGDPST